MVRVALDKRDTQIHETIEGVPDRRRKPNRRETCSQNLGKAKENLPAYSTPLGKFNTGGAK
jgi:hypothetical protein